MNDSKKAMICLLAAIILTGCSNSGSGSVPAETKGTEDIQVTTKAQEPEIGMNQIETYQLAVEGKYEALDAIGGEIKTKEREYSFSGYPIEVELINSTPGVLEIEAIVADDFFKTVSPVKIVYEYDDLIKNATIENNGNIFIEPTQPFDFEMFYDEGRNLALKYHEKVEKTIENPIGLQNVEIPITKDNVENIEYAYNIEYPGINIRNGEKSALGYNGGILFTFKNGDKYVCSTYLYYKPYEKKMYGDYKKDSKSPVWDIKIAAPKKIE